MSVELVKRLFTVEEYHRMGEVGILGEDDRVELIEGEIVQMSPIGSRHAACVDRLLQNLMDKVKGRAIVRVQSPIRLGDRSEPQPDLVLLRPREDFYASGHPGPGDVLLVIEVAESSAEYDREVKVPLYARYGIVEVWLVDLERNRVEVYREPKEGRYWEVREVLGEEEVRLKLLPEVSLGVGQILV